MMHAAEFLVLAGRRDAVSLGDELGASVLCLSRGLPSPQRAVEGTFDAALARGWRGVICAAHPFDPAPGARVAALWPGVPLAHVAAPSWPAQPAWTAAASAQEAAAQLPIGLTVFATTGRSSEAAWASYEGEVILRQSVPHAEPPAAHNIRYDFASGAYDAASETRLFETLGVDALVLRNTGGTRGYGKVAAGMALNLRIIMLERPVPDGVILPDLQSVRAWMEGICG